MKSLTRKIFYSLPVSLRYLLRKIIYLPHDLLSKRNPLVPPKGKIFIGSGDFLRIGNQFFQYFKKFGKITPDSSVLDIGCGIGRMAVPFTSFLSSNGKYEGFDIVKSGIDWCTKNITSRYPNFHFKLIPLQNDLYIDGKLEKAAHLKFPYDNKSFDFVFLTSVFTHMLEDDVMNYISEIHRVLKDDSICFATFFILDEESESAMKTNGVKQFNFHYDHYSLMDNQLKEANVAYRKDFLFENLKKYNFEVLNFIRGNWSGLTIGELNEHQDILILKKL